MKCKVIEERHAGIFEKELEKMLVKLDADGYEIKDVKLSTAAYKDGPFPYTHFVALILYDEK